MLEAPITAVTVFRDGARVQRSGTVSMAQGRQAVVIGGLPASVDPASVRVAARGPGLALLNVEVHRGYRTDPLREEGARRRAEAEPADGRLVRPAVGRHGQRTLHPVHQAGPYRVAGFGHERRGLRLSGVLGQRDAGSGGAHRHTLRRSRRHGPGPSLEHGLGRRDRRGPPDVPGIQLGQALMPAAPRGGQDQLHRGPVLPRLLGHLGQVADHQLLAVQRQVVERPPGGAG